MVRITLCASISSTDDTLTFISGNSIQSTTRRYYDKTVLIRQSVCRSRRTKMTERAESGQSAPASSSFLFWKPTSINWFASALVGTPSDERKLFSQGKSRSLCSPAPCSRWLALCWILFRLWTPFCDWLAWQFYRPRVRRRHFPPFFEKRIIAAQERAPIVPY